MFPFDLCISNQYKIERKHLTEMVSSVSKRRIWINLKTVFVIMGVNVLLVQALNTTLNSINLEVNKNLTLELLSSPRENVCVKTPKVIFHVCKYKSGKTFCKKVLNQFKLVSDELNNIKQFLFRKDNDTFSVKNGNHSMFLRSEQCKILKEKFVDFKDNINKVLAKPSNKWTDELMRDIVTDDEALENCAELVDLIQCGINHLMAGFLGAIRRDSLDEIYEWKTSYDQLFKGQNKIVYDITKSLNQSSDLLKNSFSKRIQDLTFHWYDFEKQYKRKKKELISSELNKGKIQSAVNIFYDLRANNVDITDIVERTYMENRNHSKIMNIADFIDQLQSTTQKELGYRKLLDLIKTHRNTTSDHIAYFYHIVNKANNEKFEPNILKLLRKTRDTLKSFIGTVIDAWVTEIRNGINDGIVAKILDDDRLYRNGFPQHVEQIIKKAFAGKVTNTIKIFKAFRTYTYNTAKVDSFYALFNLILEHNHVNRYYFLMVIYRVRNMLDLYRRKYPKSLNKSKLVQMKSLTPVNDADLIWQPKTCTIFNTKVQEYLYAANDYYKETDSRRSVFTFVPGGAMNRKFHWELIPMNRGEYFRIKNVEYGGYMYASNYSNPSIKTLQYVFTWNKNELVHASGWKIIPKDQNFVLSNIDYPGNLGVLKVSKAVGTQIARYDHDRRYVYWRKYQYVPDTWRIRCFE